MVSTSTGQVTRGVRPIDQSVGPAKRHRQVFPGSFGAVDSAAAQVAATVVTRPLRRHPSSLPAKTGLTGCFSGRSGRACTVLPAIQAIRTRLRSPPGPGWSEGAFRSSPSCYSVTFHMLLFGAYEPPRISCQKRELSGPQAPRGVHIVVSRVVEPLRNILQRTVCRWQDRPIA